MVKKSQENRTEFSLVYILGGSPCSGKTTIAKKLSEQYHLQFYSVDDQYQEHVKRCDPDRHPIMHKVSNMGWNEIWSRPTSILVSEEFEYYRELFELILEDLQGFDFGKPIIVEGAALIPEMIERLNIDVKKVLYMVPTKEFQIHHYSQREFIHEILKDCADPDKAFKNWMMRDHFFGKEVLFQAKKLGYGTIILDGERTIDEQFAYVSKYYGFL